MVEKLFVVFHHSRNIPRIGTDRNGEFLGIPAILVSGLDCPSDILKSLESWASSTIFGQVTSFEILGIKQSVESSLVESFDVFESRKILVSSKGRFLTQPFDGFEVFMPCLSNTSQNVLGWSKHFVPALKLNLLNANPYYFG